MIKFSSKIFNFHISKCTKVSFSSVKSEIQVTSSKNKLSTDIEPLDVYERLSKFISNTGICSRKDAESWIKNGRVTVDGIKCDTVSHLVPLNKKILVQVDGIKLNRNRPIKPPKLWAVYKYKGELMSNTDIDKQRKLLLDRMKLTIKLPDDEVLKPITRLDYNTEGLCLLTDNGVLARCLESVAANLKREYRVRVHGLLTESKLVGLRRGVYVSGKRQKPMDVEIQHTSKTISWIKIATEEASNRTIGNCLKEIHLNVTRMICVGFGPYKLSQIPATGYATVKLTDELSKLYLQTQNPNYVNSNPYKKKTENV